MKWEYIAGFFDGEGTIAYNGRGFRITIPQTNEPVLQSIKKFTGVGNVIKVTKRRAHWKDSWVYYIAKQKDVYFFVKKICFFLIVKEKLAKKALDRLEKVLVEWGEYDKKRKLIIKNAKKLRRKGLTYRQIGKELSIDFGYARRVILRP